MQPRRVPLPISKTAFSPVHLRLLKLITVYETAQRKCILKKNLNEDFLSILTFKNALLMTVHTLTGEER